VIFRGVKYCDPCTRPNKLAGVDTSFRDAFFDRGGLVAEILQDGTIRVGDIVIPPKKSY
jgi:MOSC domain-containing protein YiiM